MNFSRRDFLKTTAVSGGGLLLGFHVPRAFGAATPGAEHQPNAWVRIGEDNTITLLSARSEMGQGVSTALPMLLAEELAVDLAAIRVETAPPAAVYVNALLGVQITGGSTSVREGWEKLRVAGAQVREMLVAAAAARWGVAPADCRAERGHVLGPGARRATYGELAAAAAQLPVPPHPTLKDPKDFRLVGRRTRRLDTPAKVNGTARFGIDVQLPGMVFASLEQCPVIGGKVRRFDASRARALPGVVDVVAIDDGIAVVATSYWRARQARDVLDIEWDEGAGAALNTAAMAAAVRSAADHLAPLTIRQTGDAATALAGAARVVRAEYFLPHLAHATLEPMNFTADARGDRCHLIGPTQYQQGAQAAVAAALGLPPESVTVETTFLGGGFGRRLDVDFIVQAAQISRAVGRPVKLLWTREDDMTHDFYRPMAVHRLAAGLDADGRPVALTFQLTSQSITQRAFGLPPNTLDDFMIEAAVAPYAIPHTKHEVVIHDAGLRVGYWRSVSHALNAFANESFMDELAAAAGQDPYAYRQALLTGQPRFARVLRLAAERAGWGQAAEAGRSRGLALMEGYQTYMAQVAEISVTDGVIKVHRVVVAADLGRMVNPDTVEAQIRSAVVFGLSAALHGEITLEQGRVQQTNFHQYLVQRMDDTPPIEVILVESEEAPGGIGEPATALIGPAVANALFAATGRRVRRLPLTPENLAQST